MSKSTINKLFVGGIVAMVAGLVLGVAAVWATFAAGEFVMDGPDVVGAQFTAFGWTMVGLMIIACVSLIGGGVAGLVSWVGALLNTAQLDDKLWFILLLVLGLFSFGFIAMIAYVIAGPDGTRQDAGRSIQAAT
jgi:hypothetical protein